MKEGIDKTGKMGQGQFMEGLGQQQRSLSFILHAVGLREGV